MIVRQEINKREGLGRYIHAKRKLRRRRLELQPKVDRFTFKALQSDEVKYMTNIIFHQNPEKPRTGLKKQTNPKPNPNQTKPKPAQN